MQSPGYQNGSDGDSSSAASSCVNMLRDVQNQFKDRAFHQVQNEFPALHEALLADRQNKVAVRTGKTPRNAMSEILKFGNQYVVNHQQCSPEMVYPRGRPGHSHIAPSNISSYFLLMISSRYTTSPPP
jgi:hypothetical protein